MIVKLDDSIATIRNIDDIEKAGLETVLSSSFNGNQLIVGSFRTLDALCKLNLSDKSNAVLKRAREKTTYSGSLIKEDSFVLTIKKNGDFVRRSDRTWEISVEKFSNMAFPINVVLGENMLDAEAYIFAAHHAKAKLRLPHQIFARPAPGGGSQIPVAMSAFINYENGFCFCITDGDYSYPTKNATAVTNQCIALSQECSWPATATDIPVRSIENLIPLKIIDDVFTTNLPDEFHLFQELAKADNEVAKYLDIKYGLRYCKLCDEPEGVKKIFWNSKFQSNGYASAINDFKLVENPDEDCKCNTCPKLPSLGKNTLSRVVDFFKNTNSHKVAERMEKDSHWLKIGLDIYYFCLADDPIRF